MESDPAHTIGYQRLLAQQLHEIEERLVKGRAAAALQPCGELTRDPHVQPSQEHAADKNRPREKSEKVPPDPAHCDPCLFPGLRAALSEQVRSLGNALDDCLWPWGTNRARRRPRE